MTKNRQFLMLPVAALTVSMLAGCSSMGALLGANQPVLSPGAKAAAEMPLEKEPVINTQETYLSLVRQMQSKSLWYASIAHLDALDKQWGPSSDSRLLRADALRQVGQTNAATPIYQGLLGSAKDGAARYGLGRVAADTGDFAKAAQQMEQARMSNPVDPQLLTDLGYAYLRARNLKAAQTPLMQAAQLNPEDPQINVNLSLFMLVNGQAKEAETFMQQRKLDAQTQQAVKDQATQWFKAAESIPAVAAAQPAGQVVNLSRPEVQAPKNSAPVVNTEPTSAVAHKEAVREEPVAKKSVPEPEPAQAPVLAAAPAFVAESEPRSVTTQPQAPQVLMAAQASAPQSASWTPSAGGWMVSGSSFDSSRPRYPGGAAPQTYAYAMPTNVQQSGDAPVSVAIAPPTLAATPSVSAAKARSVSSFAADDGSVNRAVAAGQDAPKSLPAAALHSESASQPVMQPPVQQPVVPRQPTGPAKSLQDDAVVMAVAQPGAVRQVGQVASSQRVQTMLPRSNATAGLYFETPDEPQPAKAAAAVQPTTRDRVWP